MTISWDDIPDPDATEIPGDGRRVSPVDAVEARYAAIVAAEQARIERDRERYILLSTPDRAWVMTLDDRR